MVDVISEVQGLRERMVRIETMLEDIHRSVMGNGRQGLLEAVAEIRADTDHLKDGLAALKTDLDDRAPTRKQKNAMMAGGVTGAGAMFVWLLTEILPHIKLGT